MRKTAIDDKILRKPPQHKSIQPLSHVGVLNGLKDCLHDTLDYKCYEIFILEPVVLTDSNPKDWPLRLDGDVLPRNKDSQ